MERLSSHSDSDISTSRSEKAKEFSQDEMKKLKRIVLSSSFRNLKQARRRFRTLALADHDLHTPQSFLGENNERRSHRMEKDQTKDENEETRINPKASASLDHNVLEKKLNSWEKEVARHPEAESGQCSGEDPKDEKPPRMTHRQKSLRAILKRTSSEGLERPDMVERQDTNTSNGSYAYLESSFLVAEIEALEQLLDDQEDEIYSLGEKLAYHKKDSKEKNYNFRKAQHALMCVEDKCAKMKLDFTESQSIEDDFQHELTQSVIARDLQLANMTNDCNQLALDVKSLEKVLRRSHLEKEEANKRANENEAKLLEALNEIAKMRQT